MLAGVIHVASLCGNEALTHPGLAKQIHPRPSLSDLDLIRPVQVGLSTYSVWLVFLLGCELFDRRAALAAAALFGFMPELVGFSHLLRSETLFVTLNLGWALLLLRGLRAERIGLLAAAGAVLALAALTRQVVASFVVLAIGWMFLMRPKPWRGTAKLGAALLRASSSRSHPGPCAMPSCTGSSRPWRRAAGWRRSMAPATTSSRT
jgi:hypothetical protein